MKVRRVVLQPDEILEVVVDDEVVVRAMQSGVDCMAVTTPSRRRRTLLERLAESAIARAREES